MPGKRLTEKFREQNRNSGYKYVAGAKLPPRKTSASASSGGVRITTPPDTRGSSPDRSGTSPGNSSSPRKVVSSFKAFGAASPSRPQSLSVFGAKMLPTGPGGGMFGSMGKSPALNGGMRDTRGAGDDDDDEEEDVGFKKDSISLDQVSVTPLLAINPADKSGPTYRYTIGVPRWPPRMIADYNGVQPMQRSDRPRQPKNFACHSIPLLGLHGAPCIRICVHTSLLHASLCIQYRN